MKFAGADGSAPAVPGQCERHRGGYRRRASGYPSAQAATPDPRTHDLSTPAPATPPRRVRTPAPAVRDLALQIAQRLDEKQAKDIVVLDVSGPLVIADYFVVATVTSTRQGQALAKELDLEHKALRGRRKRNAGGMETEESNWVLLDFDEVVVHLFLPEARAYYALEDLWADVPRLPFTPQARTETGRTEVRQPTLDGFGAFQPDAPTRSAD